MTVRVASTMQLKVQELKAKIALILLYFAEFSATHKTIKVWVGCQAQSIPKKKNTLSCAKCYFYGHFSIADASWLSEIFSLVDANRKSDRVELVYTKRIAVGHLVILGYYRKRVLVIVIPVF